MTGKLHVQSNPDSVYLLRGTAGEAGTFALFSLTGSMHLIPIAGATEECPGIASNFANDDDVATFLANLNEGPVTPTSLGGLPGFAVHIDAVESACRNAVFHLHGLIAGQVEQDLQLVYPGRFIAARTGAGTVGALIYAPTDAALADWLPVSQALLNGLRFDASPPSDPALSGRTISVSDFTVPFTYRLPVGLGGQLEAHGSGNKVYLIDGHTAGLSGTLELFPVSGIIHGCGEGSGNGLPTSVMSGDPSRFLNGLREGAGAGVGSVITSTLGNLPAVTADVDPSVALCPRVLLHIDGLGLSYAHYEPALDAPGRLILTQLRGKTFGAWISAPTDRALPRWLPIAQALVDGLEFDTGT
jgi:hypothetical protein